MNGYLASALMLALALIIGFVMIWLAPEDEPRSSKSSK